MVKLVSLYIVSLYVVLLKAAVSKNPSVGDVMRGLTRLGNTTVNKADPCLRGVDVVAG